MKRTMEQYIPRWRLALIALLVVVACAILIKRLWEVQVSQGESYATRLRDQTTVSVRLSPARGAIVDRNGIPLAENRASFDVDFYLDELVRYHKRLHRGAVPTTEVRRRLGGKWVMRKEPDILQVVQGAVEELSRTLGTTIELNAKELQDHFYQTPNIPFQVQANVDFATLARFSERNLGIQGVEIAARPVRAYNYGALAAHILGYVGKPTDRERLAPDGHEYEVVGHAGVERVLDGTLQGTPGGLIRRVNYQGYIVGEEANVPPSVGNSLYLTLDARLQYIVEEVMRSVGRGACVIVDPNNGDILAMVSVPSFDPNAFIPKIPAATWKQWNEDPTAPLLNRAVQAYAPGSTFKTLVALAGLKSGAITPRTVIDCPPGIEIGGHFFGEHSGLPGGLGPAVLHDALRLSCNTFFYKAGNTIGIRAIEEMGQLCGFGEPTGVPIPGEMGGILFGVNWLKKNRPKERWTSAYTANASIGQGAMNVTPLQMAMFSAAVANGGTVFYPRLTIGVSTLDGETVISVPTRVRAELGVAPEHMVAVREALLDVVRNGTARRTVPVPGFEIAGKTGSAQAKRRMNGAIVKDTRAWFTGFAPYHQPRYAFAIVVEGGVGGGATAGPIAHQIFKRVHEMETTGVMPEMGYLTPAVGHFKGVVEDTPRVTATSASSSQTVPGSVEEGVTPTLVNENDDSDEPRARPAPAAPSNKPPRSRAYSR